MDILNRFTGTLDHLLTRTQFLRFSASDRLSPDRRRSCCLRNSALTEKSRRLSLPVLLSMKERSIFFMKDPFSGVRLFFCLCRGQAWYESFVSPLHSDFRDLRNQKESADYRFYRSFLVSSISWPSVALFKSISVGQWKRAFQSAEQWQPTLKTQQLPCRRHRRIKRPINATSTRPSAFRWTGNWELNSIILGKNSAFGPSPVIAYPASETSCIRTAP